MSLRAHRVRPAVLMISSLVGLAISLYAYTAPLTGVTGTAGALLVVISSLLLALAGGLLIAIRTGWFAQTIRILAVLGSIGTMAAGFFLHEFWLMAAMAVVLFAAIADLASKEGA